MSSIHKCHLIIQQTISPDSVFNQLFCFSIRKKTWKQNYYSLYPSIQFASKIHLNYMIQIIHVLNQFVFQSKSGDDWFLIQRKINKLHLFIISSIVKHPLNIFQTITSSYIAIYVFSIYAYFVPKTKYNKKIHMLENCYNNCLLMYIYTIYRWHF